MTVHPHARGANFSLMQSSFHPNRFIPTHVGQMSSRSSAGSPSEVHPHARGANVPLPLSAGWQISVHPHARGANCCGRFWSFSKSRFIPTHVGQIHLVLANHPAFSGSSPRTWGKYHHADVANLFSRFIPTHVGQMRIPLLLIIILTVHPHARGANCFPHRLSSSSSGSSPRTWGKLTEVNHFSFRCRFIPTHVGQICCRRSLGMVLAVHPHARGANIKKKGYCVFTFRFIPTHVGQMMKSKVTGNRVIGSSPRTWGKFFCTARCQMCPRFIPTHVGQI